MSKFNGSFAFICRCKTQKYFVFYFIFKLRCNFGIKVNRESCEGEQKYMKWQNAPIIRNDCQHLKKNYVKFGGNDPHFGT